MSDLFVRKTYIKTPCETYRCKGINYIEIGADRGPGNLIQRFCRDCFVQVIKKAPAEIIAEALGSGTKQIADLKAKIAELEIRIKESEPIQNIPVGAAKDDIKPEVSTIGCKFCDFQYAKNTEEPCKSCKESIANGKGFINFKAREKKQEG